MTAREHQPGDAGWQKAASPPRAEDRPKGFPPTTRRVNMTRPPFEEGTPTPEARPLPCPECGNTKGYSRVGPFRVQCLNCNALVKNEEVDMKLPNQEK